MIPKLIFDREKNRQNYNGTDKDFEEFCILLDTFSEFSFDAYKEGTNCLLNCFNGYEDWNQPNILDYGYALTPEAIDKYIISNYNDNNPNKFLIEIGLMSFDYDKPWKCGTYVDKEGNNTYEDYYNIDSVKDEMKNSYINNCFITFGVYDITNKN